MKKMTMIVAILLVAAVSQAAQVQWNSGAIKTPDAFGVPTLTNVSNANGPWTVVAYFWLDNGANAPGSAVVLTTGFNDTTASAGAFSALTSDSFAASTKYWGELVITKNDGTWTRSTSVSSFTTPDTGNGAFNTGNFTWNANWTPIPEPTSMALLAIGVAAIGLRRKFMK